MIRIDGVSKQFPGPNGEVVDAVAGLSLTIAVGECVCLIGGSGSGKTTVLRLINRLLEPTAGQIEVDGKAIAQMDAVALRRSMGYVVQRGALFPHLNIAENIGLLCDLESWSQERTEQRVFELLDLVQLRPADFADRYPNELSGGQRQRVGVARALALDPSIVLLDEPFGALDPITRRELQQEFLNVRKRAPRTMVFVTHDLDEAFRLGDRVAIMQAGKLLQVGTEHELLTKPATAYVQQFVAEHHRVGSGR